MVGFSFTLRQVEVFETIRECASFRLAAEKLGISQAAVSNHLKSLEDQLGVTLFAREPGKRPSLTAQGAAFTRDLQPFLGAAAILNGHKRRQEEIEAYRFKVYVGLSLLENFVRPKLDHFLKDHPEIDLEFLAEAPDPETLRKIFEDRFDFALLHLMRAETHDDATRVLARCRSGVFAHRSILPPHDGPLTADQVSRLPFLLPPAGTGQEKRMIDALDRAGIRPCEVAHRTQFFDVLSALVEQGVGAGLLGETFIRPEMRREVELVLPFEPWRIVLRRSPRLRGKAASAVERFLIDSVLADGRYPALPEEPALRTASRP
jgi:DNA-binding transcriptional LysR family regulator